VLAEATEEAVDQERAALARADGQKPDPRHFRGLLVAHLAGSQKGETDQGQAAPHASAASWIVRVLASLMRRAHARTVAVDTVPGAVSFATERISHRVERCDGVPLTGSRVDVPMRELKLAPVGANGS
jgi:hypothetical protein